MLDGVGYLASQGKHTPPTGYRQLHERLEMDDQRIAVIFDIEFEWLGRKYRRAARPPGQFSRKGERRVLEQEDAAVLSLEVARKQNPSLFCPIKNAGIEALRMPGSSGWNGVGCADRVDVCDSPTFRQVSGMAIMALTMACGCVRGFR